MVLSGTPPRDSATDPGLAKLSRLGQRFARLGCGGGKRPERFITQEKRPPPGSKPARRHPTRDGTRVFDNLQKSLSAARLPRYRVVAFHRGSG
jgi:hypothetical protein